MDEVNILAPFNNLRSKLEKDLEQLKKLINSIHNVSGGISDNSPKVEIIDSDTDEKGSLTSFEIKCFELNDSKNGEYNKPLYMKKIDNGMSKEQLICFKDEFIESTDKFFDSLEEQLRIMESKKYDENDSSMVRLLCKKKRNLNNFWGKFEENISKYMDKNIGNTYNKIRYLCSSSIKELLENFPYNYCTKCDNEISYNLINAFNEYMSSIGVSSLSLYSEDDMDFEAYDVNSGSFECKTKDKSKLDKVHSINRFAYIFYEEGSDQDIHMIVKGDAFVYNVV